MITQQRLQEVLNYCPETGVFTWKGARKKGSEPGMKAGTRFKPKRGKATYTNIKVDGKVYLAHRLAFLYMTGSFPADMMDHRDGNGENNAWANLRECTRIENYWNIGRPSSNTSGEKHVCWDKQKEKWCVVFQSMGKRIFHKSCKDYDEAVALARIKRAELHAEFCNNN